MNFPLLAVFNRISDLDPKRDYMIVTSDRFGEFYPYFITHDEVSCSWEWTDGAGSVRVVTFPEHWRIFPQA